MQGKVKVYRMGWDCFDYFLRSSPDYSPRITRITRMFNTEAVTIEFMHSWMTHAARLVISEPSGFIRVIREIRGSLE
jgi:hypothetical protein